MTTTLTLTLPTNFTLVYYRFTLQAVEPLRLPANKGSTLRGGFGHTFKRLACSQPWVCDKKCHAGNDCPYGYIFETAPPEGSERLSKNSDVPRPFIIEPPRDQRNLVQPGEQFSFGLVLVGQAMNYFAHFLAVFRELGWVGLGEDRGQYRVVAIDAVSPYDGRVEPVYRGDDTKVRLTDLTPNAAHFTRHTQSLPTDRLTVDFLTPTRLKHRSKWVNHGPPFSVLVKALLSRVSSLSYFHCGQPFEVDFKEAIAQADPVKIVNSQSRWADWSRLSGRQVEKHHGGKQHRRIEMGGLVGRVTYQGNLAPYLPLLALGELIHVGKGTVFGNGQYQIVEESK